MSSTANFRRQHEELMVLARALSQEVAADGIDGRAAAIRVSLARFAGKLQIHASMEEEALYPWLLAHPDPVVRARAAALHAEFGPVYGAFAVYVKRWATVSAIQQAPEAFARETREVIGSWAGASRRRPRSSTRWPTPAGLQTSFEPHA
jgi:hypothetical protein